MKKVATAVDSFCSILKDNYLIIYLYCELESSSDLLILLVKSISTNINENYATVVFLTE